MLSWLRHRRERAEAIEAEAAELIRGLGAAAAYSEARVMERDANNFGAMRYWRCVALAVSRQKARSVCLEESTGMAMDANIAAARNVVPLAVSPMGNVVRFGASPNGDEIANRSRSGVTLVHRRAGDRGSPQ